MITLKPILRTSIIYFIALVAIGLSGIFISRTLPSNMDSALFIAQKELQELRDYHKEFGLNNIIVITTTTPQQENLILKQIQLLSSNFVEETLVLTPFAENKNTSSVMISVTSTEYKDLLENFDLLSRLLDKGFKEWSIAGNLWTNYHLAKQNIDIQERIFPAIFILIGLLLVIFLRNIVLSLVIFLVSLSCTGYSFLLIKLIKNEVHLLTNIVPLMNFVIPLAISFHLIYGLNHYHGWLHCWHQKKKALFLTSLTTIAGIASLYLSSISVIKDFALLGSITISFNFMMTLIVIYLLKDYFIATTTQKKLPYLLKDQPHKKSFHLILFMLTLILTFAGFLIIPKLPVLVEAESFFHPTHPVSLGLQETGKALGGIPLNEWVLEKNTPLTYDDLKLIDEKLVSLNQRYSLYRFLSPMELIKKANLQYTNTYSLPDFEISARTLYGKIPHMLKGHIWQQNKIKISVIGLPEKNLHHHLHSMTEDFKNLLPKNIQLKSHGEFHKITTSQQDLIHSLLYSFFSSFLISTIVVSYYLKSFSKILSFILVNLAPIFITLLLFPLLQMQLNMATIMSFSISFGLIVDGTIHLLFAPKGQKIEQIKNPIFMSNIAIICAFMPLSLHRFVPIWQFGLCLALILIFGLLYDLWILEKIALKDDP